MLVLCCEGFALVVESEGCSPVVVRRLLIAVASLVEEPRLNSCGAQAALRCRVWDLPGSEIESVSPALAGVSLPLSHKGSS